MLLQELRHENVVELIEVFVHNAQISLVFEYCVTDLEIVIKDMGKQIEQKDIKAYMLGTIRGLAHCHANWVLHRDLKPGNLLLDANGTVKLADFGLARFYGSPERKYTGQVRFPPKGLSLKSLCLVAYGHAGVNRGACSRIALTHGECG